MSRYLVAHHGSTLDFAAIIDDPEGFLDCLTGEQDLPFAHITAMFLRRLGSRYARIADHLEELSEAVGVMHIPQVSGDKSQSWTSTEATQSKEGRPMPKSNTESSNARQDRVGILLERVTDDIKSIVNDPEVRWKLRNQAEQAADWLVEQHPHREVDEMLVSALRDWLPRLKNWILGGKVSVFFSYKAEDAPIAEAIGQQLENWSARRLRIRHMAVLQVGRDWRAQIEATIPQCDWFLLLLPTSRDQRDWLLYEAGYFSRGQGLAGRLVCLHHPDNEVSNALGSRQSVPAEVGPVRPSSRHYSAVRTGFLGCRR